jgi:hypothetical protein
MFNIGATFAPTQDPQRPAVPPVESAVKLLSTALPRTYGAPTSVNPQLLAGSGGGVHPDIASAVMRSVLAALFGPNGLPGGLAPTRAAAPGSEAGALGSAVSRGAGSVFAPPQFSFSNPPPRGGGPTPAAPLVNAPPPPGSSGAPETQAPRMAPPAVPMMGRDPSDRSV